MQRISRKQIITHWKTGAKQSLQLAHDVFAKKHYDHALFCGHLALEKILKAKIIGRSQSPAPYSHDLLYLAGLANINLTTEQQKFLTEVNQYNIAGRYPEEKLAFHRAITKSIAQKQLKAINDFYLWVSTYNEPS